MFAKTPTFVEQSSPNFMQCRKTSAVLIRFAILPSVVECESQEGKHVVDFGRFSSIWRLKLVVMATSLEDPETNTLSNIYSNMSINPENLVKIGLVGSAISLLQAIVKKE